MAGAVDGRAAPRPKGPRRALVWLCCLAFVQGCGKPDPELLRKLDEVRRLDGQSLGAVLDDPRWGRDIYVLAAVAQHPQASAEVLDALARRSDRALHEKLFGRPEELGTNRKGLAVMRLVASHPQVDVKTLVHLSTSPNAYVVGDVLANPKTPEHILRSLHGRGDYLHDWGLATNPRTPPDILAELATRPNVYTRTMVARHPNAPTSVIEKLARDPDDWVRREAARRRASDK